MRTRRTAVVLRALLATLPGAVCVAVFAVTGAEGAIEFGVAPREFSFWLLWSFFHLSWSHVLKNAALLSVVTFIHLIHDPVTLVAVAVYAQVVGGLLVWLAGSTGSVHAGASGVGNALVASLLIQRLSARRMSLGVAALVVLAIGGAAVAFEAEERVSSEGHLFGYACGVVVTVALTWRQRQLQQQVRHEEIV
jgi:membrane associated rhomboid family serine protease